MNRRREQSRREPIGRRETMDRRRFLGLAAMAGGLALLPLGFPRPAGATAVPEGGLGASGVPGASIDPGASVALSPGAGIETARAWRAMGTLIEVRVPDLPPAEAVEAVCRVRRRVEELEAAMTLYRAESPLVSFNRMRAGRWLDVPGDLAAVVDAAIAGARDSAGAYDPTVAPLMRAWGLVHLDGRVPSRETRRAWRHRPGPDAVEVDLANHRLRRLHDQVELDLGGIGKGVAVDAALAELSRAGSRSALVNFGGSIGVLGAPPDSPEGWPVGIAHPRRPGTIWSEISLRSGHLATSGDSERAVQTKVGRAHHVLDPRTGESARGVASVTAWSTTGVEADVRSTSHFITLARGEKIKDGSALTLLDQGGPLRALATGGFGRIIG